MSTGRRSKRQPKIIEYEQLKAAAGGSGSGTGSGNIGIRAGQFVACKVLRAACGGYDVKLHKHNVLGFLPTEATLNDGDELVAQFVCMHNNRVLLSSWRPLKH